MLVQARTQASGEVLGTFRITAAVRSEHMCTVGNIFSGLLPWPCAAVAAAHAGAAGRGSSQRPGPPEVSESHSTLCRGPPCTCGESAGNLPYPAGRGGGKGWVGEMEGKG